MEDLYYRTVTFHKNCIITISVTNWNWKNLIKFIEIESIRILELKDSCRLQFLQEFSYRFRILTILFIYYTL